MGCLSSSPKTRDPVPRCAPNSYPRNPAYPPNPAGYPAAVVLPPQGRPGGMMEGAAMGYMIGSGNMGMMGECGPQVAIGGAYHGVM
ncbi:hypothetical protein ScPMuIL_011294 [Solemya velum]